MFLLDFLKNENQSLPISVFFFTLSLYAYHSAKIFIPLLAFFLIFIYKEEFLRNIKKVIIAAVFAFVLLLPLFRDSFFNYGTQRAKGTLIFFDQFVRAENQYLFEIQKKAFLKAKSENNFFLMIWNQKSVFILRKFVNNYLGHLNPKFLFFSTRLDNQRLFISRISLFYPFEFLLIIIGLWSFSKIKKSKQKSFLFSWLGLSIVVPSLSMDSPHPLRGMFYLFILEIFSSLGLFRLLSFIKTRISPKIVYFALTIFFLNFIYFVRIYLKDFPKKSAIDWQYGVKQVSQYVKDNKDKYDRVYILDTYRQTYIFYLFYSQRLLKESEVDKHMEVIDNVYFTNDIPAVFSLEEKTLLVKFRDKTVEENRIKQKVYFPDGDLAFTIYEY